MVPTCHEAEGPGKAKSSRGVDEHIATRVDKTVTIVICGSSLPERNRFEWRQGLNI